MSTNPPRKLSKSARRRRNAQLRKKQQQPDNADTTIDIFNPPADDLNYMEWEYEFAVGDDD